MVIHSVELFLLSTALAVLDLLCFHTNYEIFSPSICEEGPWNFYWDGINLSIAFPTRLALLIHEHGGLSISQYLSPFLSLVFSSFHRRGLLIPWLDLFKLIYYFCSYCVTGTVALILFSVHLLLVQREENYWLLWVNFVSWNLLNVFINSSFAFMCVYIL